MQTTTTNKWESPRGFEPHIAYLQKLIARDTKPFWFTLYLFPAVVLLGYFYGIVGVMWGLAIKAAVVLMAIGIREEENKRLLRIWLEAINQS